MCIRDRGDNYAVDGKTALTDPEEAKKYIEETGVDMLAVAIGTAHGAYVGTPKIHFDRLQEIKKVTGNFPLVLHGGSGSGDENLRKACQMGINKVTVCNDLMRAACDTVTADVYKRQCKASSTLKSRMRRWWPLAGRRPSS